MKKNKKWILLPLSVMTVATPVVTMISCSGSENKNGGIDNNSTDDVRTDQKNIDVQNQIDTLTQTINDLKQQLNSKEEVANNVVDGSYDAPAEAKEISDLRKKLLDLQTQVDNINNVKSTSKQLTLDEKETAFQAFESEHATDLSQLSFDQVKAMVDPNLPWARGVANFSLAQGASYLYNLAQALGYQKKISPIYNLSVKNASNDATLDRQRTETFNYVKAMFDGIKPLSDDVKMQVVKSHSFKAFQYMYASGGKLTLQRLTNSGLNVASLGYDKNLDIVNGATSQLSLFSNFTFTDSTNQTLPLFDRYLVGMAYSTAQHPGGMSTQIYVPATKKTVVNDKGDSVDVVLTPAFTKEVEVQGVQPIYPVEKSFEKTHDMLVLEAMLRKISIIFADENQNMIQSLRNDASIFDVPQELINAMEFLGKKFNEKDGYTMAQVSSAYDSLNNGSHYFKAVELFARGVNGIYFEKNDPLKSSQKIIDNNDSDFAHDGIISMSNDHIKAALLSWGVNTGYGAYQFGTDKFDENYDLLTYKPTTN